MMKGRTNRGQNTQSMRAERKYNKKGSAHSGILHGDTGIFFFTLCCDEVHLDLRTDFIVIYNV